MRPCGDPNHRNADEYGGDGKGSGGGGHGLPRSKSFSPCLPASEFRSLAIPKERLLFIGDGDSEERGDDFADGEVALSPSLETSEAIEFPSSES